MAAAAVAEMAAEMEAAAKVEARAAVTEGATEEGTAVVEKEVGEGGA